MPHSRIFVIHFVCVFYFIAAVEMWRAHGAQYTKSITTDKRPCKLLYGPGVWIKYGVFRLDVAALSVFGWSVGAVHGGSNTRQRARREREKHFANMRRDESVYASNEMDFVIFFGCFAIFNIAQLIYGAAIFLWFFAGARRLFSGALICTFIVKMAIFRATNCSLHLGAEFFHLRLH